MGFIQLHGRDAPSLEDAIIKQLEADGINFADCRSQCYENASVMSGLQKCMLDRNPFGMFINSLNPVGVNAVSEEPMLVTFFGVFDSLFIFPRSTFRWEEMKKSIPITVKRECETRWSARFEVV